MILTLYPDKYIKLLQVPPTSETVKLRETETSARYLSWTDVKSWLWGQDLQVRKAKLNAQQIRIQVAYRSKSFKINLKIIFTPF